MENKLLSEINSMRSMMGLINEAEEMASQAADLSKAQSLAKLEGLNIDIKNFLDKTNPMCKCPKTGNEEQDGILKKIWSWANDPANKGKLKDTFTKVKSELSQAKKESKLVLLGSADYHTEMLKKYQIDHPEIYIFNGNVAFETVYELQKNASVNIILESKSEISPFLPGKFPHCIEANRTILLLSPFYSETKRLLGQDYSFCSEVDDVQKIAMIIKEMHEIWKNNPNDLLLNRTDLVKYLSFGHLKTTIENLDVK